MTSINPFITSFRVVDKEGTISVEFKRYLDQILTRVGGLTGGSYTRLTDGATIIWDLDTKPISVVVLGGNRTLANPLNQTAGNFIPYRLTVVQDATGSRLITWGSAYKFPSGTAPVLSTSANAVDVLTFISDGTNMILTGFVKDVR